MAPSGWPQLVVNFARSKRLDFGYTSDRAPWSTSLKAIRRRAASFTIVAGWTCLATIPRRASWLRTSTAHLSQRSEFSPSLDRQRRCSPA